MNTAVKKILLTGTALVVASVMSTSAAQAQQIILDGAAAAVTTASAGAGVSFTGTGAGTGNVAGGNNIGGPVTTTNAGAGTLNFAGNSTVTGPVGAGNNLAALNINGGTVQFTGAANAVALTLAAITGVQFGDGGTITNAIALAATNTLTVNGGTFTATGGITGGTGAVVVNGTAELAGGTVNVASLTKSTGATAATVSAQLTTGTLTVSAGTLNVSHASSSVSGATAIGANTLNFGGASLATLTGVGGTLGLNGGNVTVAGAVGATGAGALHTVNLSGTGTKTFNGNVYADNLNIADVSTAGTGAIETTTVTKTSAGSSTIANAMTVAGGVNVNGGTLTISNAASTVAGTTAINGNTLNFGGASLQAVTGVGGTLALDRTGAQSVGAVGTAGNSLATLDLAGSGTKTLTAAVYATTTQVRAVTVNSAASLNGNVAFLIASGVVNLADTANITGNVTGTTASSGTINFAGTSAVDGTVGDAVNDTQSLNINGNNTKTVTFNGAVRAGQMVFDSSGNVVMSNTSGGSAIYTVTKNNAGTATLTNQATVLTLTDLNVNAGTLDINGVVNAAGTATLANGTELQFEGATLGTVGGGGSTLTLDGGAAQQVGAIGAAGGGNALTTVNMSGLGDKTVTGAIYAGTTNIDDLSVTTQNATFNSNVNFTANGTLNLASASTITGNVANATAGHGTLSYTGGLNITGNLARLNTLTVGSALTVGGNAVAADNMNVGIETMTVGGTFETTANTQLTYRVNTPTTSGKITATGEATVLAATRVNMIVDTNVYVNQGQEFVLVDGAESGGHVATLTAGNLTTTNTALLRFKQKTTDTNNLVVYADRVQMNQAATVPNNAAVGTMLDSLGANGDADVTALQVALGKLDTAPQVEAMLATLVPDVSGGSISAAVGVGGSTSTVVNNRVAALRAGESYGTGMAAGNWAEGGHFWGQVFGSTADQDRRDNVAGYDSESYGTVFGVDTEVANDIRAGVALAYANTEVDGDDANRTQTDLDSYQISLYGSYDLPDNYFLTGQVSYMYSDIDTTRYNVGQIAGNNARADFSSNQYTIRTEVGRDYTVDGTRLSLTPSGTFNYTYVDLEDYTERGAGGLSLRNVDTDEVQILEFGGNLRAEAKFEDHAGGVIAPNLHAGYRYDVIGDKVATSGRLTGGGAAFKSEGFEPSQHTVNVGTGIKWTTASDFEFTLNYDYEHKSDYAEHSGFARAGFKF